MTVFDIAAVLLGLAAIFGYINHRLFKLPHTIGLMVITLAVSLGLILWAPEWMVEWIKTNYVGRVDFNKTLMDVMLSFLLFAGALHVNISDLMERKWAIGALSTAGVLISTAIVGFLAWWVFNLFGFPCGIGPCLVFGALISPTDPVAVLGLLKVAKAPKSLEIKIAGESLFNDGVGVVVFTMLATIFHMGASHGPVDPGPLDVAFFFLREVGGGAVCGLLLGYIAYAIMKTIDQYQLEVIVTLALVTGAYSVASAIGASGPIAVVIAGLFIGNRGKRLAMSDTTVDQMEKFWSLIDEILNSLLFLLIGIEIFQVPFSSNINLVQACLLAIPVVLIARFISVFIPISILKIRREFSPGVVPIIAWCGLRGGISVALVFSLTFSEDQSDLKSLLMVSTYFVVLFSIIVQGLTVKPLINKLMKGKK